MSDDKLTFFEEEDEVQKRDYQVAVVASRYNAELVDGLLARTVDELVRLGVQVDDIFVRRVPGAHEIPFVSDIFACSRSFDAVIALGVLVAGETNHHQVVAEALAHSLMDISVRARIPVINGVLCVNSVDQAKERIFGDHDRGAEFAATAIEMMRLHDEIRDFDEASLMGGDCFDQGDN